MTTDVRFMALVTAGALALAGCSAFKTRDAPTCEPHTAYETTATEQRLRAPQGLQLPEEGALAPMPSGPRAAVVTLPDGRCLESPPSYFARPGEAVDPGLPVAQSFGVAGRGRSGTGGAGSGPVLISGASVLTNEVAAFLNQWAEVWTSRNVEEYFQFYGPEFAPAGYADNGEWRNTQRERFVIPARTEIVLETVQVETRPDGAVQVEFVQRFGAEPNFRSVLKEMTLQKGGPRRWTIVSERILDVL